MTDRDARLDAAIAAYLEASGVGGPPDRAAFLARYPDLADSLAEFLDDHDRMRRAAGPAPEATVAMPPDPDHAPTLPATSSAAALGTVRYFGDYELLEEIARGGMGVVYRARQVSLNRVIALKMILAGHLASEADVRRFRQEAEAAANLDHPNILPVYEVGEYQGQHYFSMKFLDGGTLADRLKAGPQADVRALCLLLVQIGRAVHFAHLRGVLHRDLKPANILLDRAGQPFVADFGLARRIEGDSGLTQSGAIVGTPSYMAPEQARAEKQLTTAADVYALGAILYAGLTGRPPFQAESVVETMRQVLERDPDHPRTVNPAADRDLSVVALKCLAKEPAKRYPSAADLADDLERWLRGEPIRARPAGPGERSWRWVRRHPGRAALAATALLLAGAVVAAVVQTLHTNRLRVAFDHARAAQMDAERQEQRARLYWYAADVSLAERRLANSRLGPARAILDRQVGPPDRDDPRGFEWHYLRGLFDGERRAIAGAARCVALSPDGSILAVGGDAVRLFDPATGNLLATLPDSAGAFALAFPPDGKVLAVPAPDGKVRLWDVAAGRYTLTLPGHRQQALALAFAPDGQTLATGGRDDFVRLWDAATGAERAARKEHANDVLALAWSADGTLLASAGQDWVVRLWDPALKPVAKLEGHAAPVLAVAFRPDGKSLASGGGYLPEYAAVRERPGELIVWDVPGRKRDLTLSGHRGPVTSLIYPTRDRLVSAGLDGVVRRWVVGPWDEEAAWRGHPNGIRGLAVAGRQLAAAGPDGVKLWDADQPPGPRRYPDLHEELAHPLLAFADNGKRVVDRRTGKDWEPRRWTAETAEVRAIAPDGRSVVVIAARSTVELEMPAARMTVVGTEPHMVLKVIDLETRAVRATMPTGIEAVQHIDFDPTGRFLAASGMNARGKTFDGRIEVWDLAGPVKRVGAIDGIGVGVLRLAVAPDGRAVGIVQTGSRARLFDTATAAVRMSWPETGEIAFAPTGDAVAVAAADGSIRVLDAGTLAERGRVPARSGQPVRSLVYAPDGRTLAVAWGDEVWFGNPDLEGGWTGPCPEGGGPAFSPDGKTLATHDDTSVTLWQVATGQELIVLRPARHYIHRVAFGRDGQALTALSHHPRDEGTDVTVWPAPVR